MSAPSQHVPRRIGQTVYLKPECIEDYKRCHAAVWPAVLEQIKQCNIRDYSIFLIMQPRPTLFASFKYIGNDWEGDMAKMAANLKVQEWWRMTDAMQESAVPGAIGSAEGPGWWMGGEEVFYVE